MFNKFSMFYDFDERFFDTCLMHSYDLELPSLISVCVCAWKLLLKKCKIFKFCHTNKKNVSSS